MDVWNLLTSATLYIGTEVAKKGTDDFAASAWARIKRAFGFTPAPEGVDKGAVEDAAKRDPELEALLVDYSERSSLFRRLSVTGHVLDGARLLWIDDEPAGNTWERRLFEHLGVKCRTAETTRSALGWLATESFDIVLSDIARPGSPRDGIDGLSQIRASHPDLPFIFYVGSTSGAPVPSGAQGLTTAPDELVHLVLDQLERRRL